MGLALLCTRHEGLQKLAGNALTAPDWHGVHIQERGFQSRQIARRRRLLEKDKPTACHNRAVCLGHPHQDGFCWQCFREAFSNCWAPIAFLGQFEDQDEWKQQPFVAKRA
jgi:hypothetical protein